MKKIAKAFPRYGSVLVRPHFVDAYQAFLTGTFEGNPKRTTNKNENRKTKTYDDKP
jgi:hypothetical protein